MAADYWATMYGRTQDNAIEGRRQSLRCRLGRII